MAGPHPRKLRHVAGVQVRNVFLSSSSASGQAFWFTLEAGSAPDPAPEHPNDPAWQQHHTSEQVLSDLNLQWDPVPKASTAAPQQPADRSTSAPSTSHPGPSTAAAADPAACTGESTLVQLTVWHRPAAPVRQALTAEGLPWPHGRRSPEEELQLDARLWQVAPSAPAQRRGSMWRDDSGVLGPQLPPPPPPPPQQQQGAARAEETSTPPDAEDAARPTADAAGGAAGLSEGAVGAAPAAGLADADAGVIQPPLGPLPGGGGGGARWGQGERVVVTVRAADGADEEAPGDGLRLVQCQLSVVEAPPGGQQQQPQDGEVVALGISLSERGDGETQAGEEEGHVEVRLELLEEEAQGQGDPPDLAGEAGCPRIRLALSVVPRGPAARVVGSASPPAGDAGAPAQHNAAGTPEPEPAGEGGSGIKTAGPEQASAVPSGHRVDDGVAASPAVEGDARVLLRLRFDTRDLVAVDLAALERRARGVNHVVLSTTDGHTCVPCDALPGADAQGTTFLAPLQLLQACAVEPLPPRVAAALQRQLEQQQHQRRAEQLAISDGGAAGAAGGGSGKPDGGEGSAHGGASSGLGAGSRMVVSASMPSLAAAAAGAARELMQAVGGGGGSGGVPLTPEELRHQQEQLCRWMADGGSAIAPLGAMHSLDEESAALLTPADAPALISATTSNLASAAHQGFMPSMIAMLFGPSSSPLGSRPSSPAPGGPPYGPRPTKSLSGRSPLLHDPHALLASTPSHPAHSRPHPTTSLPAAGRSAPAGHDVSLSAALATASSPLLSGALAAAADDAPADPPSSEASAHGGAAAPTPTPPPATEPASTDAPMPATPKPPATPGNGNAAPRPGGTVAGLPAVRTSLGASPSAAAAAHHHHASAGRHGAHPPHPTHRRSTSATLLPSSAAAGHPAARPAAPATPNATGGSANHHNHQLHVAPPLRQPPHLAPASAGGSPLHPQQAVHGGVGGRGVVAAAAPPVGAQHRHHHSMFEASGALGADHAAHHRLSAGWPAAAGGGGDEGAARSAALGPGHLMQGFTGAGGRGAVPWGPMSRVYDVEGMEASAQRVLAVHGRLRALQATSQRLQERVVQLTDHGQAAAAQQQALASMREELEGLRGRAEGAAAQAAALRALCDETHAGLQARLRQQQAASRELKAARQRLSEAEQALQGTDGWGSWRALHSAAAGRTNALVAALAAAYELGPRGASIRPAGWAHRHPNHPAHHHAPPKPPPGAQQPAAQALDAAAAGATRRAAAALAAAEAALGGDGRGEGLARALAHGAQRPRHRPTLSLEDMLAAQPLEQRMDASWWALGTGDVRAGSERDGEGGGGDAGDGSEGGSEAGSASRASSDGIDGIIHRVLNAPTASSSASHSQSGALATAANAAAPTDRPPALAAAPPLVTTTAAAASNQGASATTTPRHAQQQQQQSRRSSWTSTSQHRRHGSGGDWSWGGGSSRGGGGGGLLGGMLGWGAPPRGPSDVPLCVLGLELPSNLAKRSLEGTVGWGSSPDEEQRVAAALGYVAHLLDRLSVYLEVPLRYPVIPAMSKSHICDPCPSITPAQQQGGSGAGILQRNLWRWPLGGSGAAPSTAPAPPAAHPGAAASAGTASGGGSNALGTPAPASWLLGNMPTGLLHTHTGGRSPSGTPSHAQQPHHAAAAAAPSAAAAAGGVHPGMCLAVQTTAQALAFVAATGGQGYGGGGAPQPQPQPQPLLLPLYTDGRDRTKFAYAVYLLNKDVELLMQAHGLASLGPTQLLPNLYTLALAAVSGTS